MRLFIQCRNNNCGRRIYLNIVAPTRDNLARKIEYDFEIRCPHCGNYSVYTVNDVFAEAEASSVPGGAIVGGLIGLIGGPLGVLVGGALGGAVGANADEQERSDVRRFNRGVD